MQQVETDKLIWNACECCPDEGTMLFSSYFNGPVWDWFSLSYASYFVMSRVRLCSMPLTWQKRFVHLMEEAHAELDKLGITDYPDYTVQVRGPHGRFVKDPEANYRYPPEAFDV